ncbi:MAG: tetratricopeptide repeat protein [Planctomycetaceae bacterium]|nr:tetratricopeptide repeat protein [Planctomycetaceae bacterium]
MTLKTPVWFAAAIVLVAGCSSSGLPWGKSSKGGSGAAETFAQQRATDESAGVRPKNVAAGRSARAGGAAPLEPTARQNQIKQLLAAAASHEQAQNPTAARTAYERVLKLDPEHWLANYQLAVLADDEGRFDEAERHYRILLKQTPRKADLLASLGWSYLLQRRYDESERALRGALTTDPQHRTALYNLGWLYGTLGDYDQALEIIRKAGSEQDAQRAIAELFPRGRPAGAHHLAAGALRNPFNAVGDDTIANLDRSRSLSPNRRTEEPVSAPTPWQGPGDSSMAWADSARSGSKNSGQSAASRAHDSEPLDQVFAALDAQAAPRSRPLPAGPKSTGEWQLPPATGNASDGKSTAIQQAVYDVAQKPGETHSAPSTKGPVAGTTAHAGDTGSLPDWPFRPDRNTADAPQRASPRQQARRDAARMALSTGPGGLPFPLTSTARE